MDNLNKMIIFAKVVELKSMSLAAKNLGMTAAAVSQHIKNLEEQSGIILLHRSTRKIQLSDAGQRYFKFCQEAAYIVENAKKVLEQEKREPAGELRIAMTVGLAEYLGEALLSWSMHFPDLRVNMHVNDQFVDLIESKINLAIRVGEMPDSSYVAKKIGYLEKWLCASPEWIKKNGMPNSLNDLLDKTWISMSNDKEVKYNFFNKKTKMSSYLTINPKIVLNCLLTSQKFCEMGLGICSLSSLEVKKSIKEGKLIHILSDWNLGTRPIWAVTQSREVKENKVVQAIEIIEEKLKNS